MRKSERNARYDVLRAEQNALDKKVRDVVFNILNQLPHKSISFVDNHAYSYVEGYENYIEVPIYGARLNNGAIELSFEAIYDEDKGRDVPSWNEDDVRDEFDKYMSINWLSILNSLTQVTRG